MKAFGMKNKIPGAFIMQKTLNRQCASKAVRKKWDGSSIKLKGEDDYETTKR